MDKWNEVMNGTNSALKDQTLSLLSRETNKTYIYANGYTRFNDNDRNGRHEMEYDIEYTILLLKFMFSLAVDILVI